MNTNETLISRNAGDGRRMRAGECFLDGYKRFTNADIRSKAVSS